MTTTALTKHAGADWLVQNLRCLKLPAEISPLGRDVADILGDVFCGLYHLSPEELYGRETDWTCATHVIVRLDHQLATHDGSELTVLVLHCHDRGIRLAINGVGRRALRLGFSRASDSAIVYFGRVPTIDEIVARHRQSLLTLTRTA